MSELRSVLFQFLTQPSDPARRSELAASLASVDLAAARAEAKQDPGSGDAAAKVVGRMILDGASNEEVVEFAKLAAQKAPREGAGNDVALLAGVVVWRLSGQSTQAEPYFRRVRRNEPANPQILAFYREMFSSDADASQLMQVLVQARRSLKKEDTDQRFALAHEMADLAEKKLGSIDRAIEVWRSVLREDGYDPRAAKALERLYREGQKWTALVELLKEEFDRVADRPENRDERIGRLLEIAELYRDQLRLDAMALATLQRILDINPRHAATIKALADTYGASGRWNDLLTVYNRLLDAARAEKDVPRQVDMLRRISNIWVDQLDNTSKGMEPLHEALRLQPDDRETRDALARIHELRKDWRALIDLRKDELASASGERACELRIALARIAEEKLNDRAEAITAWREVLAQHGDVEDAFVALIALYEREGRWPEAAERPPPPDRRRRGAGAQGRAARPSGSPPGRSARRARGRDRDLGRGRAPRPDPSRGQPRAARGLRGRGPLGRPGRPLRGAGPPRRGARRALRRGRADGRRGPADRAVPADRRPRARPPERAGARADGARAGADAPPDRPRGGPRAAADLPRAGQLDPHAGDLRGAAGRRGRRRRSPRADRGHARHRPAEAERPQAGDAVGGAGLRAAADRRGAARRARGGGRAGRRLGRAERDLRAPDRRGRL
ncbi:tetratricopeptide repeat protein [Nannocystis pusilla]|uniref:tetratricopeptide repeat protein n=1 Tax=Nannocystis pusilla TaxID=889268 RepID=UPI003DA5E54B